MQFPFWARTASRRCALLALFFSGLVRAENSASPATQSTLPPSSQEAAQPEAGRKVQASEEIEVQGHYETAVGTSDAASAGKISRQLLEDRPILRPGEVLELVPGLIITQHSGAGKANQYFLRGFNLDHGTDFLTTLDGVPINLRTHAHGQGYTDLNFLIPELVQRVDYSKGPYFASKGDFASAGAADIHSAESLPNSLVELTGGSFLYGRALLAGSPGLAGGRLLYGLELLHDDGPWDHSDDYRRLNGVVRYSRRIGDASWAVTGMGHYGVWNATDQVPLRAVESGAIDRFGAIDPTTGGKTYRFSLSGDYEQSFDGAMLTANVYAVRYRLNLFSNFTYFLDDPVNGDQFEQADDRWLFGTSGRLAWTSPESPIPWSVTLGWEARHDRIDPIGLYNTVARSRLHTVRQDFVRETSGGIYAEAEASFTPWLRAIAGLRYDHYFFDVASDLPANSGTDDAGRVSPKLTAIFGPWKKTEIFANFGVGFHSNDARGVTTTLDPASGGSVSKVTPLVQTRGGEIGIRTGIVPRVQSSLALWRLDIDSELLFTGDAGTTEPSRASRRWGIEWNNAWQPIRWLLFDLNLAWSHARFTTPDPDPSVTGDYIPGSIETALSAGVTVHELGPWTASVSVRYFGPRPLIEDDSVRSTASTIFNGMVSYRLTNWVRLTLDVFNLFNAQVDDIAYYYTSRWQVATQPAAGVTDIHFHPAESRSFRMAAAFTY
ncbi:MAG TPA: TonB-dependent receptor [Myxococcales bacterium]|nr:TonB-dependent receptor [Myxococcales bacterium]